MKNIIVYHGKHSNQYYDASNEKLEEKAFKALFKELDEDWGFYEDLKPGEDDELPAMEKNLEELKAIDVKKMPKSIVEKIEEELRVLEEEVGRIKDERAEFQKATSGNPKALKRFLLSRADYEYERVTIEQVN